MITEAQKRARDKWNKENMAVQVCNISKKKKEAFARACKAVGTSPNAVLVATINKFIEEHPIEESPDD